jgi:uncharacterized repeat protein (TIGR03837 family)
MQWDLFCRVIDNFGDIGVCWRLAADLASRGEQVRLWTDDATALAWMAPRGQAGVDVHDWDASANASPGDVVVETFGCELPEPFVRKMAAATRAPSWINLEYLSAEPYVERSHRLRSPQLGGAGAGLSKWFFYPGFTRATGGLLREPGLVSARAGFDRVAWLRSNGIEPRDGERLVSVFCYDSGPLAALAGLLSDSPTLLLLTPGVEAAAPAPGLRCLRLPYLDQAGYDRLLWSCDLNLVRGEDSFVRAQWAGRPFLWQIYPQHDAAHAFKLDAFLQRFAPPAEVAALSRAWNRLAPMPQALPAQASWVSRCEAWREELQGQSDLVTQLLGFVAESR